MKISIIMQSYLGEYPGSRKDSDNKFIRAVTSFLNQTNIDSELIIVSDACGLTHKLYHDLFKLEQRVKYVYIDKDTPNMYEDNNKYYRGFPRQVGRSLVTGDITTYMDSDDYLMPNHCDVLSKLWVVWYNNSDVMLNQSWYDNVIASKNLYDEKFEVASNPIAIDELQSMWVHIKMNKTYYNSAPWLLSHKSSVSTKWTDVYNTNISEDIDYNNRLRDDKYKLMIYSNPTYVRCHFRNLWDF